MSDARDSHSYAEVTRHRLHELETWKRETDAQFAKLAEILNDMRICLARLESRQGTGCPSPGKCLDLEKQMISREEKLETRIRRVELKVGFFTGGVAVVALFAPLVWQMVLN